MAVRWSVEETELFKKMYPIRTANQMAEIFPQYTWRQMHTKARVLGVTKLKEVATQSRRDNTEINRDELWTDEEKRILIENYPEKGGKYVYELLNKKRSVDNIKKVANRMGIKRKQVKLVWELTDIEVNKKQKNSMTVTYKGW